MTASKAGIVFRTYRERYGEFNNFYPCRIKISGRAYKSVEHYYQSRKPVSRKHREYIIAAPNAAEAKRRAYGIGKENWRRDWKKVKFAVMRKALYAKFTQNQRLKRVLLSTGDSALHEGHSHDPVWGMQGQDLAGRLLVELRSSIRSGNPRSFLKKRKSL